MKVKFFSFVLLVGLLLSACAPAATSPVGEGSKPAQDPIKIGVLYNLTGAQASLDTPSANGAKSLCAG